MAGAGEIAADRVSIDAYMAGVATGGPTELVDGVEIDMPLPDIDHSVLSAWLITLFNAVVVPGRLGIVTGEHGGYLLQPSTVRAPDVGFMRRERLQRAGLYYVGAPDIAVEVVSPGNRPDDLREKTEMFLDAGAAQVWHVYMRTRVIDRFTREGAVTYRLGDTIGGGDVLPPLTLTVAQIFSIFDPLTSGE